MRPGSNPDAPSGPKPPPPPNPPTPGARPGTSLAALRVLTDEACEAAFNFRDQIDGAVNWADLSCVAAERYETDLGETGVRVYIEEADPGASALRAFVAQQLAVAGHPNVEVITEW